MTGGLLDCVLTASASLARAWRAENARCAFPLTQAELHAIREPWQLCRTVERERGMKFQMLGTALAVVMSTAACSDAGGGNVGGAGNGGSAGAGGSGSAVLPAQGAVSLFVGPPAVRANGSSCPESGQTYDVGAPGVPSTSSPGDSVVDGESGAVISCSVRGSGTYAFSGSLSASTIEVSHYPINIAFSDGAIAADGTGTATVSVFTPTLAGTFTSSAPCPIQVVNHQVKGGSIWAEFSCSAVTSPPTGSCVAHGVLVFENCDGS